MTPRDFFIIGLLLSCIIYLRGILIHKFRELETVILTHDIKEHGLRMGDMGAVVNVYEGGEAAEVEFVTATGKTVALLTLTLSDIRDTKQDDILHVRGFATA